LGKKLEDLKNKEKIITDKEIINILEADELFTYIGKKINQVKIWTCVNRNSLKLIDFEVGSADKSTWLNLVFRLKERYNNIKYLATNGNPIYSYYKFSI
jgi:IS1 family transposase